MTNTGMKNPGMKNRSGVKNFRDEEIRNEKSFKCLDDMYTYLFFLATLTRYFIAVKTTDQCTISLHDNTYLHIKHISKSFHKTFTIRLKTTNTRENPKLDLCKPCAEP